MTFQYKPGEVELEELTAAAGVKGEFISKFSCVRLLRFGSDSIPKLMQESESSKLLYLILIISSAYGICQ